MNTALKKINDLVATSEPSKYDSISYDKYFRDLTAISNMLLEDEAVKQRREKSLLNLVHNLPGSNLKNQILNLLS